MIYVQLPPPSVIQAQINKVIRNISLPIGRAVPKASKEVTERVQQEQRSLMDGRKGTLNKTGRTSKRPHTTFSEDIQIMKFSDSPKSSRYDIIVSVPHKYWVEWGSGAKIGLPWSSPSGKKVRNYSNTAFRGYHALQEGLNNVITKNLHLQITKKNVEKEFKKMSTITGGKK